MTDEKDRRYILTISCPDRTGIVAAVAGFLAARDAFITQSSHFGDPELTSSIYSPGNNIY